MLHMDLSSLVIYSGGSRRKSNRDLHSRCGLGGRDQHGSLIYDANRR